MTDLLGTSITVFIGITVLLMGFAAYMTGQGVANTWKPLWHLFPYSVLLGFADRFLVWGLFHGDGLSVSGYVIDTIVLLLISILAYRLTQARKMATQYPWMYERVGPFTWREKGSK